MDILIEHYKKSLNGRDTEYHEGKPVVMVTQTKLPLRFGYGSYNEPKLVFNTGGIQVEDIIKITAVGELNMSN